MSFVVVVGSQGRMSREVQALLERKHLAFKLWSKNASAEKRAETFEQSDGVIDFSTPSVSLEAISLAEKARVPFVCGTTGWNSESDFQKAFKRAAEVIPIVVDSNFSLGIELISQFVERLAEKFPSPISILDIHHEHKKDAPSGTALKIKARAEQMKAKTSISSIRLGEIPGEHRILVSHQAETIELVHRASSRLPFAEGALKALVWAQARKDKPGLYTMKDVLQ